MLGRAASSHLGVEMLWKEARPPPAVSLPYLKDESKG